MLTILFLLGLAGALASAGMQPPGSMARPPHSQYCRPADQTSAIIISQIKSMVTATSGPEVENRIAVQVPHVPDSSVVLVTDEAICQQAARAYDSVLVATLQLPPSQREVFVVRVGTSYVVADPVTNGPDTEWMTAMLFTSRFVHVSSWGA
jgi:hypothetical protein